MAHTGGTSHLLVFGYAFIVKSAKLLPVHISERSGHIIVLDATPHHTTVCPREREEREVLKVIRFI